MLVRLAFNHVLRFYEGLFFAQEDSKHLRRAPEWVFCFAHAKQYVELYVSSPQSFKKKFGLCDCMLYICDTNDML